MSKKVKDAFDVFDAAKLNPSSVQIVDKKAEKVEVTADAVLVDGSASKAAIYGTDGAFVAKGYAGNGSVKSVAAVELTAETADIDSAAVIVESGLTAQLVAGAKVDFTKEDKKYVPADTDTNQVTIGETSVAVLDAKVTDVFGGAVLTDTASSKKYKVEVAPTVEKASVTVMGGTVTNVYGGGTGALSAVRDVDMFISGGKISNIYAGGKDDAAVNGDVNIYVDMNSAAASAAMNVGSIYAGGQNANVFGDVTVTVTTNGAMGSSGKIGQIIGTPAGNGVVVGSKNLVLEAYQGDFAATVKNMDTVTITSNSAVIFSKAQDKSMVNAEYIIEVSEIDNSNQSAILTLKSAYQLNKLTVSVDAALIAEGSFSRALVQGVKSSFNSSKFDVNQINVITEDGLVADYQYELVFETEKNAETGKLIFNYTGATLELTADGYVNRQGIANALTSANDIVSFGWSYDEINKNYNREIAYNFKTMGGNDTVTIDANTYFTGKLSLGSGNDKLTINGALAKLDLSGAGENTVVINRGAALDARNITTSADSVNTFVLNGAFSEVEIGNYAGDVQERTKVVYTYKDGTTTEDHIKSGFPIIMATAGFYDRMGVWHETVQPWTEGASPITLEQWLENANQTLAAGTKQDLTLVEGTNTVVVNNKDGIGDIMLGGKDATVSLADAYEGEIDLRNAANSTLIIDDQDARPDFTGSRRGTSTVVIAAKDYKSTIADLDLKYHQAALKLEDAVKLTISDGWDTAAMEIEDVEFGYNAELVVTGSANAALNQSYLCNFSGYKYVDTDQTVLGTLQDAVIDFAGNELTLNDVAGSEVITAGAATITIAGDVTASYIEFAGAADLEISGNVDADTEIMFNDSADITFRGDTEFNGLLNVGNNTADIALQDANVVFGGAIDADRFVDGTGTEAGEINLTMVESSITLASDLDINNLTITVFADILGEGKLNVTGDITINSAAFVFGEGQSVNVVDAATVNLNDSEIGIEDGYVLATDILNVTNSTLTGGAIEAKTVVIDDTVVSDTAITADTAIAMYSEITGATFTNLSAMDSSLTDVTAETATLSNAEIIGTFAAQDVAMDGEITLADEATLAAGTVTANGYTINVGTASNVDVDLFSGDVAFAGESLNGADLAVDGNLDLTELKALAGNVRVYGYTDKSSDNPADWDANNIIVGDIALDGTFEADINAYDYNDGADVVLTSATAILRNEDEAFNTKPYGSLNYYDYGTLSVMDNGEYVDDEGGEAAFIEKGVTAWSDLTVLGNVEADFTVENTLTLGKAAVQEDYVTLEEDAAPAVNANITGDVAAWDLVIAGTYANATVSGALDIVNDITVNAGSEFTAGDAKVGSAVVIGTDATDKTAGDYVGQWVQDGAKAKFASLEAYAVVVQNTIEANEVAGAELTVAGELAATEIFVGAMGKVAAETLTIDGDLIVVKGASFTAGDVAQSDYSRFRTFEDGTITLGNVTFEDLLLAGSITAGDMTTAADIDYAWLDLSKLEGSVGNITMTAGYENYLYLAKDMVLEGAVVFANAADNYLSITGSAAFNGGLTFENNLEIFFEDAEYAKFNSDITMSEAADKLTISSYYADAEMGAIAFGTGDDTLEINGNVTAKGVTAEGNLVIEGNGDLASDVTVAEDLSFAETVAINGNVNVGNTLTMANNTINGEVTVGADMVVTGDAVINSEAALDLTAAKLTMDTASLTVADINGGAELDVNVTGLNFINANITADKMTVTGDGLVLNGTVTGAVDATELTSLGGNDAVITNGVAFDKLNIYNDSTITADFTASDLVAEQAITSDDYAWMGEFGPVISGGEIVADYVADVLNMGTNATINGTVSMGKGQDAIFVNSKAAITHVVFGTSEHLDGSANIDAILGTDTVSNTLSVLDVQFDGNLGIASGSMMYIDRNSELAGFVATINGMIQDAANTADPLNPAAVTTKAYTITSNGVDYTFTFGYIDAAAEDLNNPANIMVKVDGLTNDTVIASNADNELLIATDTVIDGSVNLKDGNDKLTLKDGKVLQLNALALDGFATGADWDGTNWNLVGNYDIDLGITNVFDFGAGEDTLVLGNNAEIYAAQVKFGEKLTVTGSGNIWAEVVGTDLVVDDAYLTIGAVSEGIEINVNDAMLTIGGVVSGTINLNRSVEFGVDEETSTPYAKVSAPSILDDITAGANLVINNMLTPEGTVNNAVSSTYPLWNYVGDITGVVEDGVKLSNATLNGAAAIKDADASINEQAILEVGSISDLASLTLNGNVSVSGVESVDALNVAGDNYALYVYDVADITLASKATLTADAVYFTDMTVTGAADAVLEAKVSGTAEADALALNGAAIVGNVAMGSGADTLELTGASTINGVLSSGNSLAISGEGSLTADINYWGELTADAAITGTIDGQGADDLFAINAAFTGDIVNVETLKVNAASAGTIAGGNVELNAAFNGTITGAAIDLNAAFAGTIVNGTVDLNANVTGAIKYASVSVDKAGYSIASIEGSWLVFDFDAAVAKDALVLDITAHNGISVDLNLIDADDLSNLKAAGDKITLFKSATDSLSTVNGATTWAVGSLTAEFKYDTTDKAYVIQLA